MKVYYNNWVTISKPTHVCGKRCSKKFKCKPKGLKVNYFKMLQMVDSLRNNPEWENDPCWKGIK
jgi:hypothetical protein